MKYYFALFVEKSEHVEVSFPDLKGCATFGVDWEEAIDRAINCLDIWLKNTEPQLINPPSTYRVLNNIENKGTLIPIPVSDNSDDKMVVFIPTIIKFLNSKIKGELDNGVKLDDFNYLLKVREIFLKDYNALYESDNFLKKICDY